MTYEPAYWIRNIDGKLIDLERPDLFTPTVFDCAKVLSNVNRFGGHTIAPYNDATHAILVSRLVHSNHARAGLFHDAHEMVTGDMTSPLKRLIPAFKEFEIPWQKRFAEVFDFCWHVPEVKFADRVAFALERDQFQNEAQYPLGKWDETPKISNFHYSTFCEVMNKVDLIGSENAFLEEAAEVL